MKKESQGKAKESKATEAERKALAKENGVPIGQLFTFWQFVYIFILSAVYLLFFQMAQQRMKANLPT